MTQNFDWTPLIQRGERLDLPGFFKKFSELRELYKHVFRKFESRFDFDEAENPSYCAYRKGDIEKSVSLIREGLNPSARSYQRIANEGVRFIRIRPFTTPLTEYLKWEFLSYQVSIELGEEILLFDGDRYPLLAHPYSVDFVCFDSFAAMVNDYDENGRMVGGWLVTSLSDVQGLVAFHDGLRSISGRFSDKFSRTSSSEMWKIRSE